jgi:hypothetical protein
MGYGDCVRDAKLLLSLTPKERQALLKVADAKRIRAVCECAYNLLRGNVHVKDKCKLRRLRKYKTTLRRLVKRGESWTKKRNYLVQTGGGFLLPLLLSTVLQAAIQSVVS